MSPLEELLVRHRIDPAQVERTLRRVLEPAVPLTAGQRHELADSGFDLHATIDPGRALVDEAGRQALVGDGYTGAEIAANNGISAGRVRHKAAAGELLYSLIDGAQRFPRFQFDGDGRIWPGLDKVSPQVPEEWSWIGYRNFLSLPSLQLDGRTTTPLQWLAAGKPPAAVLAAMGNNW